ncbi:MAG: TlpA disulfide reductase family protein [Pseudomonadota bacterium]
MKTNATFRAALGAMLYGAAALSATPAAAEITADERAALMEARTGDMKKLVIHKEARPKLERAFQAKNGGAVTIDRFAGKVTVVNFWATWCPPCRKEMPYLDQLQADISGDDFEVVAIALDRASVGKIEDFFLSIGSENLVIYRDPSLRLGTEAGVLGMPVTIILDREGREVARLQGEAKWDGPEARDMIDRIAVALADGES